MENSEANKFSNDISMALLEKFSPADRSIILYQITSNLRAAHEKAIDSCEKALIREREAYDQFLNPKTELNP